MRLCLIYDCLYPYTVGGAERWYRNLAEQCVAAGHEVTYLTRRQWPVGEAPDLPGVTVVAVSGQDELYTADGRRRIGPPLRFGAGVLRHLARHRHRYDAVHLCAFPYFSLLSARLALAGTGVPIGVDWFEVWSREYWRGYLGGPGGVVGEAVQRLCALVTPTAYVFSELHRERLVEQGLRGESIRLGGLYSGPLEPHPRAEERTPLVVFAGRHIPEKRVDALPAAVAEARERVPGLTALVLGDGPERGRLLEAIRAAGASEFVAAPGFVSAGEVDAAMGSATVNVLPSAREGYGMVVIEAAALGTPTVTVAGADNAAVELIADGQNGFVAERIEDLPGAIARVHDEGEALRERTASWFADHAQALSASESARTILARLERTAAVTPPAPGGTTAPSPPRPPAS